MVGAEFTLPHPGVNKNACDLTYAFNKSKRGKCKKNHSAWKAFKQEQRIDAREERGGSILGTYANSAGGFFTDLFSGLGNGFNPQAPEMDPALAASLTDGNSDKSGPNNAIIIAIVAIILVVALIFLL